MLLKGLRPQQTCADICAPVCLSTNGATRVPVFFLRYTSDNPQYLKSESITQTFYLVFWKWKYSLERCLPTQRGMKNRCCCAQPEGKWRKKRRAHGGNKDIKAKLAKFRLENASYR